MSAKAAMFGAAAALIAPWHLGGARLNRLLVEPPGGDSHERGNDHRAPGSAVAAMRSANLLIHLLARVPAGPWKNTCLYRSVAGCLALRWLGQPATLRIGARRDDCAGELQAHAWIEGPGGEGHSNSFQVLARRSPVEP